MPGGTGSGDAGGDELLTVSEFASLHGVSTTAVYKWIEAGAVRVIGEGKRNRRIDPRTENERLSRWRRAGNHGGKRRRSGRRGSEDAGAGGAGGVRGGGDDGGGRPGATGGDGGSRPRRSDGRLDFVAASRGAGREGAGADEDGTPAAPRPTVYEPVHRYGGEAGKILDRLEDRRRGLEEYPPRGEAVRADDLLSITYDELVVLATLPPNLTGLTDNMVSRLKQVEDTRRLQIDNERKAGRLVDVDDWSAAKAAHDSVVCQQLEAIPAVVARDIASRLWLPDSERDEIVDLLRANGVDDDVVEAVDGMLRKPVDLESAVRRMIREQVERARQLVAMGGVGEVAASADVSPAPDSVDAVTDERG